MTNGTVPARVVADNALINAVLGTTESRFRIDIDQLSTVLSDRIKGRRVLVVGGAGTIGSATTAVVSTFGPKCLHVIDQNENYLAELVRDLRGRPGGLAISDFRALPVDYGAPVTGRLLSESEPYDFVLNFAALKHVRSEKDAISLLQMLDTNLVRHARFKRWLRDGDHAREGYFAVSTDKAANPTSLMGASKRLMEDVAFDVAAESHRRVSSARFANVAFSNGSLLQGFLARISRRQPLAVPRDTRRYFVSPSESGEICALAAFVVPNRCIGFPALDPDRNLVLLEAVAEAVLRVFGYEPEWLENESLAIASVAKLESAGRWPVLRTPLDTSGEKPYEEFCGEGEQAIECGLRSMRCLAHVRSAKGFEGSFLDWLEDLVGSTKARVDKAMIVAQMARWVPAMRHRETGLSLDDRL